MAVPTQNTQSTVSQGLDQGQLKFLNDEQADLKKQQSDIDAQIQEGEQRMKAQQKAAEGLEPPEQPPPLKLQPIPSPPSSKLDPNNIRHVAWATILLAIMGAATGGIAGLALMAGGLRGLKMARKDKMEESLQNWKNHADQVAEQNQQIMEQYREVEQNSQLAYEQKLAKYQAIATANNDWMTLQTLREKRYDVTAKIWDARERASTLIRNSDPTILGSTAWNSRMSNLRSRLDNFDRQKTQFMEEQDRNEAKINNIRQDLQNQLIYEHDETKRADLTKQAQDQIDTLEQRNAKLDEQINQVSQKSVPYETQLNKYLNVDPGYTVNPDVAKMMSQAGAQPGAIAKYQGKFYRLEEDGAHPATEAEYTAAQASGGGK